MRRGPAFSAPAFSVLLLAAVQACVPDAGRPDRATQTQQRILELEDARPTDGDGVAPLLAATELTEARARRTAVRALGRLEDSTLSDRIAPHLTDPDPGVRTAAAWALAQSVHGAAGDSVLTVFLGRVPEEEDPHVRAVIGRSIGRLQLEATSRRRAFEALLALSGGERLSATTETLVGVALGLEALVRASGGAGIELAVAERLGDLFAYRVPSAEADGARIRALALSALGQARRVGLDHVERALADIDAEVRRVGIGYVGFVVPSARLGLLSRALGDTSPRVAIGAVQYMSGVPRTQTMCTRLLASAEPDVHPAVRVEALAALARPCPAIGSQRRALIDAASELEAGPQSTWQPAASALTSLARIDPAGATRLLPRFAEHPSPFVRAHGARVAARAQRADMVRALAADPSPNVRTAALRGLFELRGHAIDELLLAQLSDDDPQLLITVSALLEGTPDPEAAAPALLGAFTRISAAERETWRDPRRALLQRIAELGDATMASALQPYLEDYDPLVAADVATMLESWTGRPHEAGPVPLTRAPPPSPTEIEELEGMRVTLQLRGVGQLVIETRPDVAPANVRRFVSLAERGYYDGLTFHRWAPNFVIQGGSPGANEYAGDGPYTRDELGALAHWRGAVGVSTRGRDTGDGQIFINLVHNPRLDPDYTIIGSVVEGMNRLDDVLEGTVIERAEVR